MSDTQTSTSETITAPSVAEEAEASQPPRRAGNKESKGTMALHHTVRCNFRRVDVDSLMSRIPVRMVNGHPVERLPGAAPPGGSSDDFMNRFEAILRVDLGVKSGMFCFEEDADESAANEKKYD